MRYVVGAIVVVLVAVLPLDVDAQATDSLPFRAGQWGAEFSATGSFGSVGLLRFRSNRSAWLIDVGGNVRSGTQSDYVTSTDRSSVDLRVGPRWYRPIGPRLMQFATVGPTIGYSYEKSSGGLAGQEIMLTQHSFGAGIFGELGAAWLVTPQLALGAAWQARAGYSRVTTDHSQEPNFQADGKASQLFADFGSATLRVSLHF